MDITLEQKKDNSFQVMDPTHVFAQGDLIRFRLRSAINGFLYVINQGSSGKFGQLFPRDESARNRRLIAGKHYSIPASETGWFMIKDPPGYETVYFLVSPVDLGKSVPATSPPVGASPAAQTDSEGAAFSTATPRCNDELFRARGECLDSGAGLKPIQKDELLPEKLGQIPATTGRDLIIVKDSKDTSISSTQAFEAPAIYRFMIAHR